MIGVHQADDLASAGQEIPDWSSIPLLGEVETLKSWFSDMGLGISDSVLGLSS